MIKRTAVSKDDPSFEMIDRLMSLDLPRRGVIDTIYPLARQHHGVPLSEIAGSLLKSSVVSGQVSLIATGWLDRPDVSVHVAETDGPPGAAALGRALLLGLGSIPFFLVEEELVGAMELIAHAAGLRCLAPDEAVAAQSSAAAIKACAVIPLSRDESQARAWAADACDRFDVGSFIAIEKGGQNEFGAIHTSRGANTTEPLSKADAVLKECAARGISTLGIGDGGNEIGMGSIHDQLASAIRFGNNCGCGCGGGTVPIQETDALVASTVSNWGAYSVAASLALLCGDIDLAHSEERETALLEACVRGGLIDGVSGRVEPTADGLALAHQHSFVRSLRGVLGWGVSQNAWPS